MNKKTILILILACIAAIVAGLAYVAVRTDAERREQITIEERQAKEAAERRTSAQREVEEATRKTNETLKLDTKPAKFGK